MHLKRLIVHGFKSFADRTVFDFERGGLTGIVGPNGCGKSNVFEAIRWVLGEQRPTSLRSRELTDVIFNGTVRRPPMGLCQGTLVFDNHSETLPHAATEVEVTRRVFRSGETEYLVNGTPARLKDIRDLFAGTGLGAGGYAFMEQGRIDQVLASNPLERRKVFEEAAGISRFRARKRETELKLNRVEDNLTRLHDIVEEINRQIRSLKLHAGKARSYREMTERVRLLQLQYSVHRYEAINAEQEELKGRLSELDEARAKRAAERETLREQMKAVEAELESIVEGVSGYRTRYAEVAGKIATCKEKLDLQSGYVEDVGQRLQTKTEEISSLRNQFATLEEQRVVALREREALDRDRDRVDAELKRLEAEAAVAREKGEALAKERDVAENYLRDLEQREAGKSQELARIEAEIEHLTARAGQIKDARARIDAESEELRRGLEERSGRQDEQTSVLERRRIDLTEEERRAEELEQAFADAIEALRGHEGELDRIRARADVIQGSLDKGEGLDDGTRALLEEQKKNPGFLAGFEGLLLDLIDIDLDEAPAIQAALGDAAEALVVADVDAALRGLEWLRQKGLGGARFLPLDRFADVEPTRIPGVRAKTAKKALEPVLTALVGGLEVVDMEAFADRVSGAEQGPLVVSIEGDVARDGRMLTSAARGKGSQGLVVLRAELQDLERRRPEVEKARDEAEGVVTRSRTDRDASRARIKELSVQLVNEEGEAARLDQEIVRFVRELDRLKEETARLVEDGARADAKLAELADSAKEVADAMAALAEDKERAEREVEAHRLRLDEHARERDRDVQALEEARIESATITERIESLMAQDAHLEAAIEETRRRLETDEKDVIDLERNRADTARVMEEERVSLTRLQGESEEVSSALGEREKVADLVRERLRGTAETLDAAEREIADLTEKLGALRGREGELKASMEGLLERSRDELDLDLTDPDQIPDVEPPAAADGESIDWKALETEIRRLRDKIARLGNVNMAAVEELEEAEKRATFIFRERDDLLDSRDQLKKILRDIEAQSTDMFVQTFNSVREHFSVIFRKLFGGGKAEMFLEQEDTPLESGIEIKARPPGKEFRSITLLSGGERTMTAVALLFAIFRANPAPCAFLDEVDAALDEDNTERFCIMLEEFTEQSQFVVVTHSKRTMERANLLYGVTMPERGVSRRVAVRLEQMDDHGQITDIAALNAQAKAESQSDDEEVTPAEPPAKADGRKDAKEVSAKEKKARQRAAADATPDLPALDAETLSEAPPTPRVLEAPAMARRSSRKSRKANESDVPKEEGGAE